MERMMGSCGLVCTECPAHVGTRNGDMDLLERTARQWTEEFGHPFTAEDVLCDGCLPGGDRLCSYCSNCHVRGCAMARGLASCASCDDYPCDELEAFFQIAPEARKGLEGIRGA